MINDIKDFFKLIGCKESDDILTIKKAYRALAMECHPDILRAEGVKKELVILAESQFDKLQTNYRQILDSY